MNLNKITDQRCEEREAIERVLYPCGRGLTPKEIAGKTSLSLATVGKHLRTMKESKHVRWFAEWYGRNAGYARKYVLTTRDKIEAEGV